MTNAAIKIKIMPDSPEANLSEISEKAKAIIEKEQGKNIKVEEEPIAFGLKALIFTFAREENLEQDPLTDALRKLDHVNSAEIIDFRRIGF